MTPSLPLRRGTLPELIERETHRRLRRRAYVWGSVVALLVLAVAAYVALRPKPLPFNERFRQAAITRGDVVREVQATGRLEALVTVSVGAEISGRIASVEADYNQVVRVGQVLASFDRAALQAQLAQARAGSAASEMLLAQAKTDRAQAARTLQRVMRLHDGSAASDADREAAEAAAQLATQRVEAAEAQLAAQRATLALAQTNLEHTTIRAPIDGIVIARNIDPGQTVASALQAPTLFTVAADLRKMRVIAAVDEADIGEVHAGQEASFSVNAYPERVFHGRVVEVRNAPVVVQDVVTYGAVIEVDNLDLALKPGMTASSRIRTGSVHDVLRVSDTALRFTPPEQLKTSKPTSPGLWRVDGAALRRVSVRTGLSDGELTAIESDELRPNDRVVVDLTAGGRALYDTQH
ncbi:MAG TPA: efflux RND transporter periplasmic adaptor subunit [Polyangiales bacterium]|nr:efflux RND transporter periplasmic adaptor subunit [Polyangiales bacterium]